jgi:beta-lactamase class D
MIDKTQAPKKDAKFQTGPAESRVQVFTMGWVFGWVYWQTQNLFFAVGVHSLLNEPASLLASHDVGQRLVIVFVGLGLAAAWPRRPLTDGTLAVHRRTNR